MPEKTIIATSKNRAGANVRLYYENPDKWSLAWHCTGCGQDTVPSMFTDDVRRSAQQHANTCSFEPGK